MIAVISAARPPAYHVHIGERARSGRADGPATRQGRKDKAMLFYLLRHMRRIFFGSPAPYGRVPNEWIRR